MKRARAPCADRGGGCGRDRLWAGRCGPITAAVAAETVCSWQAEGTYEGICYNTGAPISCTAFRDETECGGSSTCEWISLTYECQAAGYVPPCTTYPSDDSCPLDRCQLLDGPRERALARVAGGEQRGKLHLVEAPARRLGLGAAALTVDRAQCLQRLAHRGGLGVGLLRKCTWLGLGSRLGLGSNP